MGDGGSGGDPANRAQHPDSLLGKMLRIAVNPPSPGYTIPPDNVFASDTTLGRPEIWALGLRNPWRWSFDRCTDDLWIGDVGQNQQEEIDFLPAGSGGYLNFGWKCYEGSLVYDTVDCQPLPSMIEPVRTYSHGNGCSVSGGYVYRGADYNELYGKYFYVDYCQNPIHYLVPNGSGGFTDTNLGNLGASGVSTFGEDRWGELYCAGISSGVIYKFVSADCTPAAAINCGRDSVNDCASGSITLSVPQGKHTTYSWSFNGSAFDTNATVTVNQTGEYIVEVTNNGCTNSDTIFAEMIAPLVLSFSGLDSVYCVNDAAVNLLPNIPGGTFSGTGIHGTSFSPVAADTGTFTITYIYTDADGCTWSYSQDVRVDGCVNVPENNWVNGISLFPNPATEKVELRAYLSESKKLQVLITDVLGKIVYEEKLVLSPGLLSVHFDLKNFDSGMYNVNLTDGQFVSTKKLIVR